MGRLSPSVPDVAKAAPEPGCRVGLACGTPENICSLLEAEVEQVTHSRSQRASDERSQTCRSASESP